MSERKFYVSSDIVGFPQKEEQIIEAYRDWMKGIDGLEKIAVAQHAGMLRKSISRAKDVGFGEISLHGRTNSHGSSRGDRALTTAFDAVILDTPRLTREFGQGYEILFHAPEARKNFNTIVTANPVYVWVENDHPQLNAVSEAIDLVINLRQKGIPSALMFDICHAIGAAPLQSGNFNKKFDEVIRYLNDELICATDSLGEPIWQGVHLPVGSLKKDSLPVAEEVKFPDSMMTCLAEVLNKTPIHRIVLENQNGLLVYGLRGRQMTKIQRRNGVIFNRLINHGIFNS